MSESTFISPVQDGIQVVYLFGVPVLLVSNRKGGVGKSTTVANIAAMAILHGLRVLVIDADAQANVTRDDLGVVGDHGESLAKVMQFGGNFEIFHARHNLDVVSGGVHVGKVAAAMYIDGGPMPTAHRLRAAINNAAENYDLIIIDSPPGEELLLAALMHASTHLIIPTAEDDGSMRGLALLGQIYERAVNDGADVELIGTYLYGVDPRASKRNAASRGELANIVSDDYVLSSSIRHAKAVSKDLRKRHMTVVELVSKSEESRGEIIAALRSGTQVEDRVWATEDAINALALDFQALWQEVAAQMFSTNATAESADA